MRLSDYCANVYADANVTTSRFARRFVINYWFRAITFIFCFMKWFGEIDIRIVLVMS
jgi:hypothetical protein